MVVMVVMVVVGWGGWHGDIHKILTRMDFFKTPKVVRIMLKVTNQTVVTQTTTLTV